MSHNDSRIVSPGLPEAQEPVRSYVPPEGDITPGSVVAAQESDVQSVSDPIPLEEAPFTVTDDNIIAELVLREEITTGGVYIPADIANKERPSDVVVVGVGPNAVIWVRDESMPDRVEYDQRSPKRAITIHVGDVLITHAHQMVGLTLADNERELKVLKPSAVIGIIEPMSPR